MKYNLAFKYRIYPNKEQELLINKTFGCVRFVYNTILCIANKILEEEGKIETECHFCRKKYEFTKDDFNKKIARSLRLL